MNNFASLDYFRRESSAFASPLPDCTSCALDPSVALSQKAPPYLADPDSQVCV